MADSKTNVRSSADVEKAQQENQQNIKELNGYISAAEKRANEARAERDRYKDNPDSAEYKAWNKNVEEYDKALKGYNQQLEAAENQTQKLAEEHINAVEKERKEQKALTAEEKKKQEEDAKKQEEAENNAAAERVKEKIEQDKREEDNKKAALDNVGGEIVDDGRDIVNPIREGIVGGSWIGHASDNMIIDNNDLQKYNGKEEGYSTGKTDEEGKEIINKPGVSGKSDVFENVNDDFDLRFGVPNWGVNNYLMERDSWQKQLDSITGEPGWFYFKVFFKFNTAFGLLGDIISKKGDNSYQNSAIMYLSSLYKPAYRQELIKTRKEYLIRFVKTLSFISTKAPWFFKGIKGLDKCGNAYINDFSKEKSIELECSEEAVDMRLTTLLDMYKFAAFDEINCKEILPDNLRKFDMVVVLFHVPLRYWHTKSRINGSSYSSKSLNTISDNVTIEQANVGMNLGSNLMSYKMFTFLNCEIDPASLGVIVPNSLNNEQPFQLGKSSIKINYDRCYNHLVNEWTGDMFGPDGAKYNGNMGKNRQNAMRVAYSNFKSNGGNKKTLVDVTENLINTMFEDKEFVVGNVRSNTNDVSEVYLGPKRDYAIDNSPKNQESQFFREKLKSLKGRATPGHNIGNLYNYEVGPQTVYFENKMKALKGHGNHLSLYQYMIGPYSPMLNRKETAYFRNKMRILHHGGNVQNPGNKQRALLPNLHGFLSPYQEKYNQWLFNFKYENTLKKTATYNPYGWSGPTNAMFTRIPKSFLGKTTRNFLIDTFQKIKPKFLR